MSVLFLMTDSTVSRRVFKLYSLVTFPAVDDVVFPSEREAAFVMIERHGFPRGLAMAALAILALLSLVFVVFLVTGITIGRRFVTVKKSLVAARTGQSHVFTSERIRGVPIMIEKRLFPVLLLVAIAAVFAVCALMFVILLMTGITHRGCGPSIQRLLMTSVALGLLMSSAQGVLGIFIVIESK